MSWATIANQLLAAVSAPTLSTPVARSFVAPGPSFARDCRSLAVVMLRPSVVPLQSGWAGSCGVVPQHTFQVVFVADCVPPVNDDGTPPASDTLTAWSSAFLDDCGLVHDGLLSAIDAGAVADGCHQVSVGPADMRGPLGGTASMLIPVTVTLIDE